MVKPENKPEMSTIDFLSDFTIENLQKSADLEIKPKLSIDDCGIEFGKKVIILSIPYIVEIPKAKAIGTNKIWMIDLEYNDIDHQFIAQANSFRFQLGVLMKKLDLTEKEQLIDLFVLIWKTLEQINTPTFKGKAEMYHIKLV